MHWPKTATIMTVALSCLIVIGCKDTDRGEGSDSVTELTFGVISTESAKGLKKGFKPLLADMSKALGVPVTGRYVTEYSSVITGMTYKQVDIAWLGNKSAVEALDRAGGEVFARTVAADGSPGYWAVIIVHTDSPYHSIDEIIADGGKLMFGNGDPNSTSGYLIPSYYLWGERGIRPVKHFKRVVNANHEANALAIAAGRIDFATNNTENLVLLRAKRPAIAAKIRVIWKSPLIPNDPLVWRKDLPDETKRAIRKFFLSYGRGDGPEAERQRKILADISGGWAPFKASNDDHLLPIREMMVAREVMEIEQNESLSDGDKQAKLAPLKQRLAELHERRQALKESAAENAGQED
ncbi:hypothetical protein LCGC14_0017380 [marine sediment metagenome]|uniref:Solute-binding protein family 3/N-terminal domain-containing protein n=1 Tax=marine sediment metagenome TaxID=412755 RepID=A0A0F9W4K5_9ZZZZ|nr:phosphonate ABC transporter substrate-binding protein [Phycisphaerae bacterium]HDZ42442.1 phosphonate ABC transporter substrate-binding protein [Phycisphaerae bacterium]